MNTALIDDGRGNVLSRQALAIANGFGIYLPVIHKNAATLVGQTVSLSGGRTS